MKGTSPSSMRDTENSASQFSLRNVVMLAKSNINGALPLLQLSICTKDMLSLFVVKSELLV